MNDPAPEERTYGAGEDIPGTPGPFPFGLVSFGMASAFAMTTLLSFLGIGTEPPLSTLSSIAYPIFLLGWLGCGIASLFQGKYGWCLFGAVVVILPFTLAIGWLLSIFAIMSS